MHRHHLSIGERAALLTKRLHPLPQTRHGFTDPEGFAASCRKRDQRNRFYRYACQRLAAWEARA